VRKISPVQDLCAFFSLWRLLIREKPQIVLTHTSKAGMLGRWAAKMAGIPIILHTPHGHVFYGHFADFISRIFLVLEKITSPIIHGHNGLLVLPEDSSRLAEAIITLLKDTHGREAMGKNGTLLAKRYSVESMVDKIDTPYKELLAKKDRTFTPVRFTQLSHRAPREICLFICRETPEEYASHSTGQVTANENQQSRLTCPP
jgi:hypothetical protein